jgi:hypothetical protein
MGNYGAKAVSCLLGIRPQTLRTWERRYRALQPQRTASGRRVYSSEDLERIKLLGNLIQRGHRIGEIAVLSNTALGEMIDEERVSAPPAGGPTSRESDYWREILVDALVKFRLDGLTFGMEVARSALGYRRFVLEVASPLMKLVGDRVASNELKIFMEHALSASLRSEFGTILRFAHAQERYVPRGRARVLFTTPPGELHEFGILLAAGLCAERGLTVFYLGPNLPPQQVAEAARAWDVSLLVVGRTPLVSVRFAEYCADLDSSLPGPLPVWIGGEGDAPIHVFRTGRPALFIDTLKRFDDLLSTL